MTTALPLLLASASRRRRQLLALLGLSYSVCVSPVDEDATQERYRGPSDGLALWLAEHKALGALSLAEAANHIVITADTTVLLHGDVLGKPPDTAQAPEMLLSFPGSRHHLVARVAGGRIVKS